jgi:thioredoxin-like negative regulator of GroEL
MTGFVLSLVLQGMVLANGAGSYEQAYREAERTGQPMLILVGADWCGACRSMKMETLPNMTRNGDLKRVVFANVNLDAEPQLAGQLMRGGSIPQLLMFSKSADGWTRTQIIGGASEAQVRALIDRGMETHIATKPADPTTSKN